jgi:tRNA threonylcarbamoyladenosine biosynthesis protein TsaE
MVNPEKPRRTFGVLIMICKNITSPDNLRSAMAEIIELIPPNAAFTLHGHPGAGKTTLVKTVASLLHVRETVQSPTFNILNIYEGNYHEKFPLRIYHYDFYRLSREDRLYDLGINEDGSDLPFYIFMEWPEKVDVKKVLSDIAVYALTIETEYSPQIHEVSKRTLKYSLKD